MTAEQQGSQPVRQCWVCQGKWQDILSGFDDDGRCGICAANAEWTAAHPQMSIDDQIAALIQAEKALLSWHYDIHFDSTTLDTFAGLKTCVKILREHQQEERAKTHRLLSQVFGDEGVVP